MNRKYFLKFAVQTLPELGFEFEAYLSGKCGTRRLKAVGRILETPWLSWSAFHTEEVRILYFEDSVVSRVRKRHWMSDSADPDED